MSDDYIDRIAALFPAEVLERYVAIKDRLSEWREELWALERELMAIGRDYGVPDIDDPGAASNVQIRKALQAQSVEINSIWAAALLAGVAHAVGAQSQSARALAPGARCSASLLRTTITSRISWMWC